MLEIIGRLHTIHIADTLSRAYYTKQSNILGISWPKRALPVQDWLVRLLEGDGSIAIIVPKENSIYVGNTILFWITNMTSYIPIYSVVSPGKVLIMDKILVHS